ncbi:GntR family transcriptional regulator [Candidatus Nomurabacteria bacterium]|nr:GntR family transcriptional regulator [Candidatus Nomurabacteria bacterium]
MKMWEVNMKLDRHSSIPLYFQLKEYILKKIETGEYSGGSKIPSELDFCNDLDLSRPTVRQAVAELVSEGKLQISQNIWYIGTANNDDSTFSVSDKVYDRALTINLDSKGIEFDAPDTRPKQISYSHVAELYEEAITMYPVKQEYINSISKLDMYIIQKFRVAFGNRIMKQLNIFVPVFVAAGGTELDGIDYILATKVFRKFEGLNLSLIRDEIRGLINFLNTIFGKDTMKESIQYLERLQKMY